MYSVSDLAKTLEKVYNEAKLVAGVLLKITSRDKVKKVAEMIVYKHPSLDIDEVVDELTSELESRMEEMNNIITEYNQFSKTIISGTKPSYKKTPYLTAVWNSDMYGQRGIKGMQLLLKDIDELKATFGSYENYALALYD